MGETRKHLGWWVVAWCALAACGGGDSSNSGVVTGLPAEQKLSTLSDQDVKNACRSISDGASVAVSPEALKRALCVPLGVQAAVTYANNQVSVDVSACQQVVDECVSDDSDPFEQDDADQETEDDCDDASADDLSGCEATVGEYETCINTVLSETQRRLSEFTCQNAETLSSEQYSQDELDPADIPQCQALMTKCPATPLGIPYAK